MQPELDQSGSRPPKHVLSIDGGGVRGIIPAMVLSELERRTGRRAGELFDFVAGTSTGGIAALTLVIPGPDGSPRWSARDLLEFYVSHAPAVFAHDYRHAVHSLDGLLHEKYSATALQGVLERYFGEARLSEALTDVLIPAYDVVEHRPHFFRGAHAKLDPELDCLMSAAARATSAAPTYFEPHELGRGRGARSAVLVDGGVYANNPAMCAYITLLREAPGERVRMLSLGTGEMTDQLPREKIRHWGLAQWARPVIHIVIEGVSQTVNVQLEELLDEKDYLRMQTPLTMASDQLDDASPENIAALREQAEQLIAERSAELDAFCEALVADAAIRA